MRGIKRVVFDNGLVLLTEKRSYANNVVVMIAAKNGSMHEKSEQSGITHFVEHMLFRSNKHRSTYEIAEDLEAVGADVNGSTSQADVHFYADTLPNEISKALAIMYEAVINDSYDKEEFYKEGNNIISEIKGQREDPFSYLYSNIFTPIIFEGTPLAKNVAGNLKTVKGFTPGQVMKYKKEIFSPNRPMAIAVVGKHDEEEVFAQIQKTFGVIPPGDPTPVINMPFRNKKIRKIEKRQGIDQAYLIMGFQLSIQSHQDMFKMGLLQSVLMAGMSSRIFRELRNKRGIGYSIFSELEEFEGTGMFCIGVSIKDPLRLDEAEEVINAELKDLRANLIGSRELEKSKNLIIKNHAKAILQPEVRAVQLVAQEFQQIPYDFRKFEYYIRRLSAKSLRETARKHFTEEYTLCALVPK